MKILLLITLLFSVQAFSIVPNTELYVSAKNRINYLQLQVDEINSKLAANSENKVQIELKDNIEKEIQLIKQRVELYKKLERKNLIMYSTP